jgi:hypothetical protein
MQLNVSATISTRDSRGFCIFEIDFFDNATPHLNSTSGNALAISESDLIAAKYSLHDFLFCLRAYHNAIGRPDFSGHITTNDGIAITLNPAILTDSDDSELHVFSV